MLTRREPGGGEPRGVAPDIARELARRAGVPVKFVPYGSSGELNGSIDSGQWDIAFFAVEADRANQVDFSPGYVDILRQAVLRIAATSRHPRLPPHRGADCRDSASTMRG